jgi:hypothetical protein
MIRFGKHLARLPGQKFLHPDVRTEHEEARSGILPATELETCRHARVAASPGELFHLFNSGVRFLRRREITSVRLSLFPASTKAARYFRDGVDQRKPAATLSLDQLCVHGQCR